MQNKNVTQKSEKVIIYGDGSALGNPGPGGYGTVIEFSGEQILLKGGEAYTTNNRMEMTAVTEGLKWVSKNLPEVKTCTVVSDSKLVIETLKSGWKRKKNLDLWKLLDAQLPHFTKITWEWVKGHAGHKQNTIADRIANGEAERFKKIGGRRPSIPQQIETTDESSNQESLF